VPETFEGFCDEFGYSDLTLLEYPRVMEIFTACQAEQKGLRQLFTEDQRELLSEIC
jgi:hypothetical protein